MYNLGQKAKDQADQLERLTGQYRDLEGKTNKSAEEHEELRKIMDQIAELAPELVTGYDDMGQAILDMGDAADRAVERLREMHEVQIEAAKLDVSLNLPRLQQEFAATVDEMNWIQTRVQLVLKELETAKGIYKKNLEDQLKVEQQMLSAQSKKLDSLREEIKTYEDLQEAIRKYEAGETGTRTPTKSKPSTDLGVSIGDGKTTGHFNLHLVLPFSPHGYSKLRPFFGESRLHHCRHTRRRCLAPELLQLCVIVSVHRYLVLRNSPYILTADLIPGPLGPEIHTTLPLCSATSNMAPSGTSSRSNPLSVMTFVGRKVWTARTFLSFGGCAPLPCLPGFPSTRVPAKSSAARTVHSATAAIKACLRFFTNITPLCICCPTEYYHICWFKGDSPFHIIDGS